MSENTKSENIGESGPGARHAEWLRNSRAYLEGIGLGAGAGIASYYLLKSMGVELPPEVAAAVSGPAAIVAVKERLNKLKND